MAPANEANTILIDCPVHPAHEAVDHHDPDDLHQAVLYVWPHNFTGQWECPVTFESDEHDHGDDIVHEMVEVDTMRNGEHDTYLTEIVKCEVCGLQLDY